MIISLIIIGMTALFSRRRGGGAKPFRNISRGDLGYLCYLCSLVIVCTFGLVINIVPFI